MVKPRSQWVNGHSNQRAKKETCQKAILTVPRMSNTRKYERRLSVFVFVFVFVCFWPSFDILWYQLALRRKWGQIQSLECDIVRCNKTTSMRQTHKDFHGYTVQEVELCRITPLKTKRGHDKIARSLHSSDSSTLQQHPAASKLQSKVAPCSGTLQRHPATGPATQLQNAHMQLCLHTWSN